MIKKLDRIHLTLEMINFFVILIVLGIKGMDSPILFITALVCLMLVYPFLTLISTLIKEAKVIEYDSSKYIMICMSVIILIGCLMWYLFFNLNFNFINTIMLWYGFLFLGFSLPQFIWYLISKKIDKKKENGPRFIKNNGR